MNVLIIQSSPRGEESVTRKLTQELLERLGAREGLHVTERDLTSNPLPHLRPAQLAAFFTPAEQRSDALREAVRLSDETVDELLAADAVVISVPMWNFSVPSVLKAWIDHVVRAGRTFSYGPDGPKGLVADKPVYVISASGGVFSSGPLRNMDFLEPYLKAVLGFIGIHDVTCTRAEWLSDPRVKDVAYARAQEKIAAIA